MLEDDSLDNALRILGELLEERGEPHDAVVVGGGALLLLGLLDRPTKDLDLVGLLVGGELVHAEPLPAPLKAAVSDVAAVLGLPDDWLNAGPASLLDFGLPVGFLARTERRRYSALTLRIAARRDQVAFKLYAAVDQGPHSKHFADLERLAPARNELLDAARWCRTHDPSEGFRYLLQQTLSALGVEAEDV